MAISKDLIVDRVVRRRYTASEVEQIIIDSGDKTEKAG